jgi:hypothetical protein
VKTALPISRAKALASNHLRTGGVVKCDTAGENYALEKQRHQQLFHLIWTHSAARE